MQYYQQSLESLFALFNTSRTHGLSSQQVAQATNSFGTNKLPEQAHESWLVIFFRQFQEPLIYILLAAAAIIFMMGDDPLDAFIITGVLLFNSVVGTIQEGRTRIILDSLKRLITTHAMVIRDGRRQVVDATQLVPGDIVLLQEGERVPADMRIIESHNLKIDESILTGESHSVHKTAQWISADVPIYEQTNMAFCGTYVLAGAGQGVVVATGARTQIGAINASVQEIETDMPLKQELDRLSLGILIFILTMCGALFAIGFMQGRGVAELLVMLTALFICVVPEGLPVVMTLVLASGAYRMAKHNVLVKRMQAVEGLGRTNVIIMDKTGTLTRNELMVVNAWAGGEFVDVAGQGYYAEGSVTLRANKEQLRVQHNSVWQQIGAACALLNGAEISPVVVQKSFDVKGDPTEAAMGIFAGKLGVNLQDLEQSYTKLFEIPFDSAWQYHAAFYKHNNTGVAFIIGSSEALEARAQEVSDAFKKARLQLLEDGLRVLAVGMVPFDVSKMPTKANDGAYAFFEQTLTHSVQLLGLVGMQDTIRQEVADSIVQARKAGLKLIMATGDHQKTALNVAQQVGIFRPGDRALDGTAWAQQADEELLSGLDTVTVYSRVLPQDKLRIIKLFQQQGQIVAMTGDGVNDAPSLIAADLGVAMGGIGSEVAKQASDMILLDDSITNIIKAIEQGRHIFYALKRVVMYFFATNAGEVVIVLLALLANLPLPITAAQILWLNLVTDGFLDTALSAEPMERDLMTTDWLRQKHQLVDKQMWIKMAYMSLFMGGGSLWVFMQYYQTDLVLARTMALVTMAMFQWFNAWNCRSSRYSIFQLGVFSNRWLVAATSFVLLLQVLLVNAPFMNKIFKTTPITLAQWGLVFAISSSLFVFEEIRKFVAQRRAL